MNYWFHTDHRLRTGARFRYHDAQREAIETLVFIYEIAQVRRHRDLLERRRVVEQASELGHDEVGGRTDVVVVG